MVAGRRLRDAVDGVVGEGHRVVRLLAAGGAELVVGDRVDAALDPLVAGVVEEGGDRAGGGVDLGDPGRGLARHGEREAPDEAVAVPLAARTGPGRRGGARGIDRDQAQLRDAEQLQRRRRRGAEVLHQRGVGLVGREARDRRRAHLAPGGRAEGDEPPAGDLEVVARALDRDAVDDLAERDLPDPPVEQRGGRAVELDLARPVAQQEPVLLEEEQGLGGQRVERRLLAGRGPGDAAADRERRQAGALVDPGFPSASLPGDEGLPAGAERVPLREGAHGPTGPADRRARVGYREVIEALGGRPLLQRGRRQRQEKPEDEDEKHRTDRDTCCHARRHARLPMNRGSLRWTNADPAGRRRAGDAARANLATDLLR